MPIWCSLTGHKTTKEYQIRISNADKEFILNQTSVIGRLDLNVKGGQ